MLQDCEAQYPTGMDTATFYGAQGILAGMGYANVEDLE